MRCALIVAAVAVACELLDAAPVPGDVKALVAGLSDPSVKVRDEATAALQNRTDALPWLRRAERSADKDTAQRAAALLAPHEPKRQAAVAKVIDACIREARADLFMEWHHYWQPEAKDDLWPVGVRMIRLAQEEYAKWPPLARVKSVEEILNPDPLPRFKPRSYDGPAAQLPRKGGGSTSWSIRTDQWPRKAPSYDDLTFASIAGPTRLSGDPNFGGRFFALGPIQQEGPRMARTLIVCDGEVYNGHSMRDGQGWGKTHDSFVVCRGTFRGGGVGQSVLLVEGDVELFDDGEGRVVDSLIRASGEIRIPPNVRVVNSTIEPHAKNATAPYRFFELADAGLSLRDDEEGLVVADVKPGTPFGNAGLARGDIIRAIDDAPAGGSEQFRKLVRRALVRQGDCLVTVARGNRTVDCPVFFPQPK